MKATIDSVLKAAGHPVRVRILELLKTGGLTVNDICKNLQIEQSLTSHHLSLLTKAGFIQGNRKGKYISYAIASEGLYSLLDIVRKELELKESLSENK